MVENNLEEMSLIDHLTELRKRLLWSFCYILIVFIICFYFAEKLFAFLAFPLVNLLDTENGQGFIYTALQEAFFTELKIAFFFALFFSFPLIAIQIWKFIAPGLYTKEKRAFLPFLIATPILFFCWWFNGLLCHCPFSLEVLFILSKFKYIRCSYTFRSKNG